MTVPLVECAYAKINLCLFLGRTRSDGRHELVTLFDSVTLADRLEVTRGDGDRVLCDDVEGPNLVTDALAGLRAAGWAAPELTVRIEKRIPIAAGMGGGSADAAALLRLAPRLAPVAADILGEIAADVGADVPAQLRPGPSIGTGAGEILEPLPTLAPYGVLVLPQPFPLSTAAVYGEADRLGGGRTREELSDLRRDLAAAVGGRLPDRLLVNDLQPAAVSLAPPVADALKAARDAGADHALVCGSGPTIIGLFMGSDGMERASSAAGTLQSRFPSATSAAPVGGGVTPAGRTLRTPFPSATSAAPVSGGVTSGAPVGGGVRDPMPNE